jgi:hypothetical protein
MAEGDKGYGQQDPSDTTSPFNVRDFHIQQAIAKLSTAKVVKVLAVDTGKKEVDVQPLVNLVDGEGNKTEQGTIYGLSYGAMQWGDNAIVAVPKKDDIGIIMCSDRDISAVKAAKAAANPGSGRQLDEADGMYLGGLPGLNSDPAQTITMNDDGIDIKDRNGNEQIFNAAGISINGIMFNRTGQIAGNLPITGNLQLGGSIESLTGTVYGGGITISGTLQAGLITDGTVTLASHHHLAPSGGGNTGPALP